MTATDAQTENPAAEEAKQKLGIEVQIEKPSACERHITATIARDDVDRYISEAVDELMPKAAVPGFRNGRAPRKLVESKFRKEVSEQVKGSILMDAIAQITEDEQLSAISEPNFDYEAVEVPEAGPMTFEFDLEVRPDFNLPAWKGLRLDRPVRDFGPKDVEQHLQKMLRRHAEMIDKDDPAADGDFVTVDMTFTHDGQTIAELPDETVCIMPILSFFDGKLAGFDKLMIGARPGEVREGKVRIGVDAENEALRGQEVGVSFKITDVHQIDLPELDADLLQKLGDFENEGDLRDAVKNHLERQLVYHAGQRARQQISDLLTESADWALPPGLLRRQSQRELQRKVLELKRSGFSDDDIRAYASELRQNSQASTAKALKEHFILERIAEDEKVDAEPSDYDDEIALIASQSGENPRRVRARLEKQDLMDTLRNQIIERKVLELIRAQAQFKEVPYTPEENETEAVEFFIAGEPQADIPEAKHEDDSLPKEATERV